MTRGTKNNLGALRKVTGVVSVHYAKAGTLVQMSDGSQMRIPRLHSYQLAQEATRLEKRAQILRAIAQNMKEGVDDD